MGAMIDLGAMVPGSKTYASAVSYDNSEHNDAPERVFAIRLG